MKKLLLTMALILTVSKPARADMFGGDTMVLIQLLSNAMQQLVQLMQVVEAGQDSLDLMRDVNDGLNDVLAFAQEADLLRDPGLYRDWQSASAALQRIRSLYGDAPQSPLSRTHQAIDETAALGITLNNQLYQRTESFDAIGARIKHQGAAASPKAAQKLTAQGIGVVVEQLDESLRAQATGLKLSAMAMVEQNRKDKDLSRHIIETNETLQTKMTNHRSNFNLPRF